MEANAPITDLINEFAWRGDSGQAARSPSFSSRLEPSKHAIQPGWPGLDPFLVRRTDRDPTTRLTRQFRPNLRDRPDAGDTPPIWLKADQVVRIEIEKLGFLENRVIDEPVSRTTYIV
jgi:hypothetical protein